jgi:hypothetical protein
MKVVIYMYQCRRNEMKMKYGLLISAISANEIINNVKASM